MPPRVSGLNFLLNNGANLHLVGQVSQLSAKYETPTSLAMYCSFTFIKWRGALLRSSVDLESFVEEELRHSPFRDAGWNEDSLLDLFCCDIQSNFDTLPFQDCDDCSPSKVSSTQIELSWQEWLNHFKEQTNIENSSTNENSGFERDQCDDCFIKPESPSLPRKSS